MTFLNSIREKAGRFILKRQVSKAQVPRTAINYQGAQEIGILYDATERDHMDIVHRYANHLRQDNKKVFELGYVDLPQLPYDANFNVKSEFFIKKQLNWYHLPDRSIIARFLNQEFDLLLNLYTTESLPLQAASAYSKAHFRAGHYSTENVNYCDMMVDTGSNTDINYLIKQIDHYIKTI